LFAAIVLSDAKPVNNLKEVFIEYELLMFNKHLFQVVYGFCIA